MNNQIPPVPRTPPPAPRKPPPRIWPILNANHRILSPDEQLARVYMQEAAIKHAFILRWLNDVPLPSRDFRSSVQTVPELPNTLQPSSITTLHQSTFRLEEGNLVINKSNKSSTAVLTRKQNKQQPLVPASQRQYEVAVQRKKENDEALEVNVDETEADSGKAGVDCNERKLDDTERSENMEVKVVANEANLHGNKIELNSNKTIVDGDGTIVVIKETKLERKVTRSDSNETKVNDNVEAQVMPEKKGNQICKEAIDLTDATVEGIAKYTTHNQPQPHKDAIQDNLSAIHTQSYAIITARHCSSLKPTTPGSGGPQNQPKRQLGDSKTQTYNKRIRSMDICTGSLAKLSQSDESEPTFSEIDTLVEKIRVEDAKRPDPLDLQRLNWQLISAIERKWASRNKGLELEIERLHQLLKQQRERSELTLIAQKSKQEAEMLFLRQKLMQASAERRLSAAEIMKLCDISTIFQK